MRTTAARYIDATEETTAKLAKTFQCTPKFVYLALTYRSDTEKARKIRYTAVKEYGAMPMCHCPECETLHNVTEDGREYMVQRFKNGVILTWEKGTSNVWLRANGKELKHYRCGSMERFSEIQVIAENM